MKKRLISILSIFACLCVIFTLGSAPVSHASEGQYTADTFSGYMNEWMQLWLDGDKEALDASNEEYTYYGMPVTYEVSEDEYEEMVEEAGAFKEYSEAVLTQNGNEINVKQNAICENKIVDFSFTWNMQTQAITWLVNVDEDFTEYVDEWVQLWMAGDIKALNNYNKQYTRGGMNIVYEISEEDYNDILEKAGEVKEYSEPQVSVDEEKGTISVKQNAVCSEKNVSFSFIRDEQTNTVTWTVDIESTPVETFIKACLNTLMGMGTVFVVLIFISFVISLFVLFSKKNKKSPAVGKTDESLPPLTAEVSDTKKAASDDEIIAVISAAIAAYEADNTPGYGEAPADGLFVRSIKRR